MSELVLWLVTYLVHSSAIYLVALGVERTPLLRRDAAREWVWRAALLCPLLSASAQVGLGWTPWTGRAELPFELELQPGNDPVAYVPAFEPHVESPGEPSVAIELGPVGWLGVGTLLGVLAIGLVQRLRLRFALGRRERLVDESWTADLVELGEGRLGRGLPRLTMSERLDSPVAIGVLRPEICVPARAVHGLSSELRRAVLAHELAHHARLDPFWLELSGGLRRVFAFQPGNRLAHERLCELSEFGADALATRWTGDRFALARSLTEVAGWIVREGSPAGTCAMVVRRQGLERRIAKLIDRAKASFELEAGPFARIAVLTAAVLMPFALPGWTGSSANEGDALETKTWSGAERRAERLGHELAELRSALGASPAPRARELRFEADRLAEELARVRALLDSHDYASSPSPFVPPAEIETPNR